MIRTLLLSFVLGLVASNLSYGECVLRLLDKSQTTCDKCETCKCEKCICAQQPQIAKAKILPQKMVYVEPKAYVEILVPLPKNSSVYKGSVYQSLHLKKSRLAIHKDIVLFQPY